jgi:hypothetical protein
MLAINEDVKRQVGFRFNQADLEKRHIGRIKYGTKSLFVVCLKVRNLQDLRNKRTTHQPRRNQPTNIGIPIKGALALEKNIQGRFFC